MCAYFLNLPQLCLDAHELINAIIDDCDEKIPKVLQMQNNGTLEKVRRDSQLLQFCPPFLLLPFRAKR